MATRGLDRGLTRMYGTVLGTVTPTNSSLELVVIKLCPAYLWFWGLRHVGMTVQYCNLHSNSRVSLSKKILGRYA